MRPALIMFTVVGLGILGVELYREFLAPEARPKDPVQASRVVCQTLFCAEVAAELAPEPDGPVVSWPEIARDARYSLVADRASDRPVAAGSAEAIAQLRPDLVVVASYTRPDTLSQLERLGIALLVQPDPQGFDAVRAGVMSLAVAIGREEQGRALVGRLDQQLDAIARAIHGRPHRRVLGLFDGSVPGAGTTFDAAVVAAGLTNAAATVSGWGQLDQERVASLAPDVIVVPAPDDAAAVALVSEKPALAVWLRGGGKVLGVSSALLGTASHHLARLAATLAERVHGVRIP